MKKTADVIIIGGGINGCATAYYLAKRGIKGVLVLEADDSIGRWFIKKRWWCPSVRT